MNPEYTGYLSTGYQYHYLLNVREQKSLFHFADNLLDRNPRLFKGFFSQFVIQGPLAVDTFIFLGLVPPLPLFPNIIYNQQFVLFLFAFP